MVENNTSGKTTDLQITQPVGLMLNASDNMPCIQFGCIYCYIVVFFIQPPLPKRQSKDRLSNMSESDDYASHLQVDATPPIAAKTLRRTRKKNGSQVDLSKVISHLLVPSLICLESYPFTGLQIDLSKVASHLLVPSLIYLN